MSALLDSLRAKRLKALEQRIQTQERVAIPAHDQPPTIIVPNIRTGEMQRADEYQLEERAKSIQAVVIKGDRDFRQFLDHEETEVVENTTDIPYDGTLNSVSYHVPARSSKRLPMTLAQHYRRKIGYLQKQDTYEKRTGAATAGQAVSRMDLGDFSREVKSYDAIDVDQGIRRKIY